MSERVLVTLATYNERENLPRMIQSIMDLRRDLDVLVIDDNSPDGTGQTADGLAITNPRVHVIHRKGKEGLGTAIISGMRYAITNKYHFVLNLDADFSHHPKYIQSLLAGMGDKDVMIGSRYVRGGGISGWPFRRRMMSKAINLYARLLLGVSARDTSGAFRCYRVTCLATIDFSRVISRGYSFQEEILFWCQRAGCRIGEAPIVFDDRRFGHSKMDYREAVSALFMLFWLGLRRLCRFL